MANTAKSRNSNHFIENVRQALLRGGRMTKYKGQAASYAPMLGTLAVALMSSAAVMLTGTSAIAGSCTETAPGSGIWNCAGAANSATDATQAPTPAAGGALTVSTSLGFGIDTSVSGGNAISLITIVGDTNITFTDANSAAITGAGFGISARNVGTGATSVTASGAVTGTNNDGILAYNSFIGTGLTVSAATVTGGASGVYARNDGAGTTSVTTTGTVTGTANNGIFAGNSTTGTDLTVTAATVTGGSFGILARNDGTGATSVTATGAVSGTIFDGIYANNGYNTTNLTVSAAAVTGGQMGIRARNYGSGATSVTATGTVTGGTGGILAYNYSTNTNLTVSAAAVTGGSFGIQTQNNGTGATSVTATGYVKGTTNSGIYALTRGTDLTVTAAAVTGGLYGISAKNDGTGATSVTATGDVIGGGLDGINAYNGFRATDLTVTAAAVTGARNGIVARNYGSGATSVTASGAVTGGTGYGISTTTLAAGANTTITLNAGAAVSSTAGLGIFNNLGNSATTVNAGASVAGKIVLGAGSDTLTFAGGDFSAVTLFDGGDDTSTADGFIDVLSFVGSSGALMGANVINWENVTIGAGSTVSFSDGVLNTGVLTVAVGGSLDASGGNFALTGNMANTGGVTLQNGATGDSITVSGDYSGTGTLMMDVNTTLDTADTLAIAGNSSGTTLISVNNLTPLVATGNDITLVTVGGTSTASNFSLAGGTLTYGAFDYVLLYQTGNFVLGQSLNSTGSAYLATPVVLSGFNRLPSMEQRIDGRAQRVGHAGWIRFHGADSKATMTSGSKTDSNLWGFQIGTDLEFSPGNTGRWVLGITGQYGNLNSTINNPLLGVGTIDTTGYGLGLSATWYGNEGTYVDTQGQVNWLDSDISSSSAGSLVKGHSSTAYALSVEAGHRFILGENTAIVPQAQVTWGSIDGGSFTDSVGNSVNLSTNNSFIGRVGMAYEFNRKGAAQKFYVIGNVLHDFSSNSSVTVAGVNTSTDLSNPTSVEIGFGGTKTFGEVELYGEASARTALGASHIGDDRSFSGTLGLRMKF